MIFSFLWAADSTVYSVVRRGRCYPDSPVLSLLCILLLALESCLVDAGNPCLPWVYLYLVDVSGGDILPFIFLEMAPFVLVDTLLCDTGDTACPILLARREGLITGYMNHLIIVFILNERKRLQLDYWTSSVRVTIERTSQKKRTGTPYGATVRTFDDRCWRNNRAADANGK